MEETELALICPKCEKINSFRLEKKMIDFVCRYCERPFEDVRLYSVRGYIYVLSNPSMPDLLKIGYTERDVSTRVEELSQSAGVPQPFVVEAYFGSEIPVEHETQIHKALAACRVSDKEFFRVSLRKALRVICEVCGRQPSYSRANFSGAKPLAKRSRSAKPSVQTQLQAIIQRLEIEV